MTAGPPGALPDRARFPILARRSYLNSAAKGALCVAVRDAALDSLDQWDHEGAPWDVWLGEIERTREQFAALVGAHQEQVFVTGSVSAAFTALLAGLDYRDRPDLLLVEGDFPTLGDAALAARRLGAEPRFLRPTAPASVTRTIAAALRPSTRAVVVSAVHHAGAFALDLPLLAEACRAQGALCLVDGYHGLGATALDVRTASIDALVTGSMKYLLGSAGGYALAYCGPRLLTHAEPIPHGWLGSVDPFAGHRGAVPRHTGARRYDAGLPSILAAACARAGLDEVLSWDRAATADRIRGLVEHCAARLVEDILIDPSELRTAGPLVCVRQPDPAAASELVRRLAADGVVTGSWQEWLRISWHAYNDAADADTLFAALARALPRRR
ncbi:aminotransferase class V-fold PLP-dependent enzyme [Micromonospora rubida]